MSHYSEAHTPETVHRRLEHARKQYEPAFEQAIDEDAAGSEEYATPSLPAARISVADVLDAAAGQ